MKFYINGKSVDFTDKDLLDMGGEAKIYNYGKRLAKIYHPHMLTKEKTEKVIHYPTNLPPQVMCPKDIVQRTPRELVGFVMDKVEDGEVIAQLSNKKFVRNKKLTPKRITNIFKRFLKTLKLMHEKNVIIGDLNDLNIMYNRYDVFFIDADSYQFDNFHCTVGTEMFLDPNLYSIDLSSVFKYEKNTDYFSYSVMLFRSLFFMSPYGGIHKKYNTYIKRGQAGISAYNKSVKKPKISLPFETIPEELNQYFYEIFEKKKRGEFPDKLLDLNWKKCDNCGLFYSANRCTCGAKPIGLIVQTITINKNCKATIEFQTKGYIRFAKLIGDRVKYLYVENNIMKDDTGQEINQDYEYYNFIGRNIITALGKYIRLEQHTYETNILGKKPIFSCSSSKLYYMNGNYLVRTDVTNNSEIIGEIVENNTWIQCGKDYGFGFYRLSEKITKYFIFKDDKRGINYIALPNITGRLINAKCTFSSKKFIFMLTVMKSGKKVTTLYLLDKYGDFILEINNKKDKLESLDNIDYKTLVDNKLMSPTDDGLLLSVFKEDEIINKTFPDTEPFVDSSCQLFTCQKGIYVVNDNKIILLELK